MPARNSSLFLAVRANFAARCLSASSTTYSSFGIVKLSRTSLGFLGFSDLTTFTASTGLAVFGLLAGANTFKSGFFVANFLLPTLVEVAFLAGSLGAAGAAGAAGADWVATFFAMVISFSF